MEELHREYSPRQVQSVFLYIREAHPGEDLPHHDSFQRKLDHARKFREQFRVRRRILVDDLDGSGHRAFGGLPNMTYILSSAHTVLFRSAWTDSATVKVALDYLLDVQVRRREGARLAPFYSELLGFRWVDDAAFYRGLEQNGPKAVLEFDEAKRMWARGEHLGSVASRREEAEAKPS